tara:strand:+ start:1298 stop:2098 length:801 start_codon:yes stop_codon:yes gene_type:complete
MPIADIGDAEIYFEDSGAGDPIMFVPGLGGGSSVWSEQIPFFSKNYRTITHDHRGCGRSTYSKIEYSVDQMANDALRLMDKLKLEKVHWVGHSTGGAMGQVIAQDNPDRLFSLVLSATWAGHDEYFQRSFSARKQVLSSAGTREYARHSILSLLPPWFITQNPDKVSVLEGYLAGAEQPKKIMESRIDAICDFDRRNRMIDINAPTLVIVAEDDMVTPRYLSDELANGINNAEKIILSTGGHFMNHILIEEYNLAISRFLINNPAS